MAVSCTGNYNKQRPTYQEHKMKLLEEIPTFPEAGRRTLERKYAITSAEAFYDHAIHNPEGMRKVMCVSRAELARLVHMVEGHLDPDFVERCHQPIVKHPRGVIIDKP
jgi:hypothetical protein